jgi:hypothetical protein
LWSLSIQCGTLCRPVEAGQTGLTAECGLAVGDEAVDDGRVLMHWVLLAGAGEQTVESDARARRIIR